MRSRCVFLVAALLASVQAPGAASPELFRFRDGFWINLHHFLYAKAAVAESGGTRTADSARQAIARAPCGEMTASEKRAWREAVDFYATNYVKRDLLFDAAMVRINDVLGDAGDDRALPAGLPAPLTAQLERAAPAYRSACWTRQQLLDEQWTEGIRPLVAAHGAAMAKRIAEIYETPWPSSPIDVDVVAYANWAGAYTTEHPSHITVSSTDATYQGDPGLEMLFHEASHTLDGRLNNALSAAFAREHMELPRDLDHVVIFFTAGYVARQELRAVDADYEPVAERLGIYRRMPAWQKAEAVLREEWRPYLEGQGTLEDACARIARALTAAHLLVQRPR